MDRERDPIAELAQLIAQADPYGESAAADSRVRQETAPERGLPPAPQLPADLNAPEQAHELDECCHDVEANDVDDQPYSADEEYPTEVPRVRPRGLALVMAITGLALVGTAGVFGYREMFRGSVIATFPPIISARNEPNKIAPASSEPQAKNSGNSGQVGAITTGSIEKLVSREERPATIDPPKAAPRSSSHRVAAPPTAGQPAPNQVMPRVVAAADPPPIAPAEANSAAAATPPVLGTGYAVQVTSERSESGAQAAFRVLKARYPNQLRGRQPIIRRADLGDAGVYYRALVGPFASAEKAAKLCSGLKAAGGDCIILKN